VLVLRDRPDEVWGHHTTAAGAATSQGSTRGKRTILKFSSRGSISYSTLSTQNPPQARRVVGGEWLRKKIASKIDLRDRLPHRQPAAARHVQRPREARVRDRSEEGAILNAKVDERPRVARRTPCSRRSTTRKRRRTPTRGGASARNTYGKCTSFSSLYFCSLPADVTCVRMVPVMRREYCTQYGFTGRIPWLTKTTLLATRSASPRAASACARPTASC
jgi:hypothetical protein